MMVRKQIYIAPEQEAKLKRLAKAAGRSEADIIREALDALPEATDPVLSALLSQGLIVPKDSSVSREEARRAYADYLKLIGKRKLGLTRAVLEDRARQK
ncbi:MAG: ribbon-helix-helix protein, CopG family [Thermaceae bacterium]|nr:ribbon-helix-helix protein, CopG family [Thermaceae bacterium]